MSWAQDLSQIVGYRVGADGSVTQMTAVPVATGREDARRPPEATTYACKFVIFEVSGKIGRHFWRHSTVALEAGYWDRLLPDRFGLDPARESEWRSLAHAPAGRASPSPDPGGTPPVRRRAAAHV